MTPEEYLEWQPKYNNGKLLRAVFNQASELNAILLTLNAPFFVEVKPVEKKDENFTYWLDALKLVDDQKNRIRKDLE